MSALPIFRPATEKVPASALTLSGLQKSYGPTVALQNVDLSIVAGEVHALLGENGAGKSTLVKILTGAIAPDSGAMELYGQPYEPANILAARASGVCTAFQELSLLPNLTVAQNLALPSQPKRRLLGLIDQRRGEEGARELLAEFDLDDIDPRATVESLSLANRQRVEIARALSFRPRLLVLDEPSAVQASTEWLFERIARVTTSGTAVLYVSHRLNEIRQLCRHGTVLRSGASMATVAIGEVDDAGIFELMVGRRYVARTQESAAIVGRAGTPRLRVSGLSAGKVEAASFSLHPGEILGVAGLDGQGQRDLFDALFGLHRKRAGKVEIDGQEKDVNSPSRAMRADVSIALVPEERKTEGIFPYLSVKDNIALASPASMGRAGVVLRGRQLQRVKGVAGKVDLQDRYLDFDINDLSGGNQQKALLARVLVSGARTLLLFDPTRGVDVGTKESIYATIQEFASNGGSVLLYSSELSELIRLCDRCLVIYAGRIVADLPKAEIEETHLLAAATGHALQPRLTS
jgi:ribose transport system ATP-binding protein